MLKLIIRMPENADANVLMLSALALAEYKLEHYYCFDGVHRTDSDYNDIHLPSLEPQRVCRYDYSAEYEVDGYMVDLFFVEQLTELQKVVPFEMYFEQRGLRDPREREDSIGEIDDPAIASLFYAEASAC